MGLPVIGPDVPVVREVFEHGKHLLLAEQVGNDFIDLIREIMDENGKAVIIAENGQHLVRSQYTWQHNAQRLADFLRENN